MTHELIETLIAVTAWAWGFALGAGLLWLLLRSFKD